MANKRSDKTATQILGLMQANDERFMHIAKIGDDLGRVANALEKFVHLFEKGINSNA